jgi:plasmid maintenance system antidote protein VapI
MKFNIKKENIIKAILAFIVVVVTAVALNISLLPEYISGSIIIVTMVTIIGFFLIKEEEKNYILLGFFFLLSILLLMIINSDMINAKRKAQSLNIRDINISKLNFDNQRSMTKKMALKLAGNVIGGKINNIQLSSQYELDSNMASVQEVKGELVWVIPVDFSGFFKWVNNNTAAGYVVVSATNPTSKPKFVQKNMRFTNNAYFLNNIERKHFFNSGLKKVETHFEINDQGEPFYIGLILEPTVMQTMLSTSKVIVTNAITGSSKIYSLKEAQKALPWVDRFISENKTEEKIESYGKLSLGWLNSVLTQENVKVPTQYNNRELWLVRYNNQNWFFTGMSSINRKDNSLVEGILVNAKTKEAFRFDMSGMTDESQAVDRLSSGLGANAKTWNVILPQPFVINGEYYWGAMIVSDKGFFIKVGLVNPRNGKFVFAKSYEEVVKKVSLLSENSSSEVYSNETITINKAKYLEIKRKLAELNKLMEEL